jgi:bifunctional DNA-binding transcriptional regulator/antitoxin component of YhaV-PrlF toxin-antitoxin module
MAQSGLARSVKKLPTTAAKIRALAGRGHARAEIAHALGIRYQQVRNVLVRAEAKAAEAKAAETKADDIAALPRVPGKRAKVRVGPDRRVVLPAELSDALGLQPGAVLFARAGDDEILLLTREAVTRRVQALAREFVPEGVSLVDELLEDRRREVEAEYRGG